MAIKNISASSIPDWEYGEVALKSFSYKDMLKIATMIKETKKVPTGKTNTDGTPEMEDQFLFKDDVNEADAVFHILCAGIHYIRNKDIEGFFIHPGTTTNEKISKLEHLPGKSGIYLNKEVLAIAFEAFADQKKN